MPLLTIVFTDVVESSATKRDVSLGRDNRERDHAYLEKIQTRHFSLIRECCQSHEGHEVSTSGDAFYLTFDDPVEAVRCAVDIQKRLAAEPIETPRGPLRLRIGIHSGFPEPFEGGWHGTDVDTAARVEATATARQILLSSRTYELVRHMADVKFHPRGEFAMKGVDRTALWEADWDGKGPRRTAVPPLSVAQRKKQVWLTIGAAALVLIASDVAYRFYVNGRPPAGAKGSNSMAVVNNGRPSVAVLEFQNQGPQTDGWLATALSELLTSELATGGQLRTISGNDVATTTADLSLAGMITLSQGVLGRVRTNLQSDYVVRGSYTAAGSAPMRVIHVVLELDDTQSGGAIYASSYDGNQGDINDLARRIGTDLRDKLEVQSPSDADAKAAQASFPSNAEAIQRYAEGLKKLRTLDAIGARDDLLQVVKLEPHYALAHSALANAWEILGYDKNAEAEAKEAFDDSRGLGEADSGLIEARYRTITKQWDRAIEIYRSLWGVRHDEPKYLLDIAGVQTDADRGQDALKTLDELRHDENDSGDDPRIDYAEALANGQLSNVKEEHSAAARAARTASAQGAELLAARAYWRDCDALFALGNLTSAETACRNARQKADSAAGRQVIARAQSDLGRIMQQEGHLTEALEMHQSALSTAKDIGSQKDVVGALLNIADVQSSQGQIDESQKNLEEAIGVARKIGDIEQVLIWQNNHGVDLVTEGKYEDASGMYEEELSTARKVGDKRAESDALQNLGVVLLQTGDLKMAEDDTAQSLDIARKARLRNEELSALSSLGDIQMARGNLSGARASYGEGLKLSLQGGDEGNAANCRLGLAKLAIENGDAETAQTQSRQASQTFEKYSLVDPEGDALNTLARAFLAQNKLNEARAQIDHAGNIGVQDQVVKLSLSVTAARLGAQAGNVQEAMQTLDSDLADARRMKLSMLELEIRLAHAQIESSLHGSTANAQLVAIEGDARGAGYALLAGKAKHFKSAPSR